MNFNKKRFQKQNYNFNHVLTVSNTNLQFWIKLLRQNRKSIFQWKEPLSPQFNDVRNVLGFWEQILARFNIGIGG